MCGFYKREKMGYFEKEQQAYSQICIFLNCFLLSPFSFLPSQSVDLFSVNKPETTWPGHKAQELGTRDKITPNEGELIAKLAETGENKLLSFENITCRVGLYALAPQHRPFLGLDKICPWQHIYIKQTNKGGCSKETVVLRRWGSLQDNLVLSTG